MKVGADPELFLLNGEQYHSAHGVIPGTKEEPHAVANGAVQVDGLALEFNIEPAENENDWCNNLNVVMSEMRKMVPDNLHFAIEPCAYFTEEHINAQPPEALVLGCDPDYNAYTMQQNMVPDLENPNMRTAAGHVHIGFADVDDPYTEEHMQDCAAIVKQLDYFLALPAIKLESAERRALYGKAGAFRPKPYGVEYRVLSNFWLQSNELSRRVFRAVTSAMYYLEQGHVLANKFECPEEAINEGSFANSAGLLEQVAPYGIEVWQHAHPMRQPRPRNGLIDFARALDNVAPGAFELERNDEDVRMEDAEVAELGAPQDRDYNWRLHDYAQEDVVIGEIE